MMDRKLSRTSTTKPLLVEIMVNVAHTNRVQYDLDVILLG